MSFSHFFLSSEKATRTYTTRAEMDIATRQAVFAAGHVQKMKSVEPAARAQPRCTPPGRYTTKKHARAACACIPRAMRKGVKVDHALTPAPVQASAAHTAAPPAGTSKIVEQPAGSCALHADPAEQPCARKVTGADEKNRTEIFVEGCQRVKSD